MAGLQNLLTFSIAYFNGFPLCLVLLNSPGNQSPMRSSGDNRNQARDIAAKTSRAEMSFLVFDEVMICISDADAFFVVV